MGLKKLLIHLLGGKTPDEQVAFERLVNFGVPAFKKTDVRIQTVKAKVIVNRFEPRPPDAYIIEELAKRIVDFLMKEKMIKIRWKEPELDGSIEVFASVDIVDPMSNMNNEFERF